MANSHKACKHCKEFVRVEEGVQQPKGFFCTIDHAIEWGKAKAQKDYEKQKEKAAKEVTKKHREQKQKLKTASEYIKEAQASVNKFIRIRDHGKPCISCGGLPEQKRGGTMDAGHYRSRGAAGHLRFNVFNIHSQCVKCNRYNSGNAVDYRLNLIKKIGIERVERLENDNNPRKFDIEYLKRIKRIFNKRARIYNAITEY